MMLPRSSGRPAKAKGTPPHGPRFFREALERTRRRELDELDGMTLLEAMAALEERLERLEQDLPGRLREVSGGRG